jgi:acetyl esterase
VASGVEETLRAELPGAAGAVVPLHPQVQSVLDALNGQVPLSRPYEVAQMRERAKRQLAFAAAPIAMAAVEHVTDPQRDVPMRVYVPLNDRRTSAMLYFHGGGWVTGHLDLYDAQLRLMAEAAGAVVIGVGYRPAPESPWPGADRDADAALDWCREHYAGTRAIVIAGDSSGGHIAAGLTQRAVARGAAPALQVLVYPILDPETSSWSFARFGEGGILGTELTRWYWQHYLGAVPPPDDASLSPLRTTDIGSQPPTLLIAAGHDVLLAQIRAFGARLVGAGVDLSYVEFPDMIHGFLRWSGRVDCSRHTIFRIALEINKVEQAHG